MPQASAISCKEARNPAEAKIEAAVSRISVLRDPSVDIGENRSKGSAGLGRTAGVRPAGPRPPVRPWLLHRVRPRPPDTSGICLACGPGVVTPSPPMPDGHVGPRFDPCAAPGSSEGLPWYAR